MAIRDNEHAHLLQDMIDSPVCDEARATAPSPLRKTARIPATRRFELALFAYHRGDYSAALKDFEKACELASSTRDHARFVDICTYILRILAEREEFARIERIESRVLAIVASIDLDPRIKSRAMYALGICSCYQNGRDEQAMHRFREAIDFAVTSEDKHALAAPVYGTATVLYTRQRYDQALKELARLDILLSCLPLPDLVSASHLLRAMILRNQKRLGEALTAAWAAFESLKHHPHLVLYLHTLCVLGTIFQQNGDIPSARAYLELADRALKRDEFPRIARLVDEALAVIGALRGPAADLIFDTRTGILTERNKGEIRFEGQFVLRDLLHTFLKTPGKVFGKEELARLVWREKYAPDIHDNKIYVTIKRLRKLLESPDRNADFIMRAKTGYFLNPKLRILIDDELVEPVAPVETGRDAFGSEAGNGKKTTENA